MYRWHAKGDDKKQAAAARAISMSADDPALMMHDMQARKVIFMMDNTTRVLWPQDELLAALHAGTGYFHTVPTKYHKRRPKRQAQPATKAYAQELEVSKRKLDNAQVLFDHIASKRDVFLLRG